MRKYTSALFLLVLSCGCLTAQSNAPLLLTQLENRTVSAGHTVSFQVQVSGYPLLYYFWRKDGEFFSAANTLSFTPPALSNAGVYDVIVSNIYGCVTSAPAVLTVNARAPGITTEPQDKFGCSGSGVSFDAVIGGPPPLQYQWQFDGTNYGAPGESPNASAYVNLPVSAYPTNAGAYTLVVSNPYGSATSRVARLTVDSPGLPTIIKHPQSGLYAPGSIFRLSCSYSSCSPMACQWRSNGVALAGATNSSLNLTNLEKTGGYDLILSNSAGAVTSQVAFILVTNLAPQITCQPQSQSIIEGQNLYLAVWAYGAPRPSYHWLRNGLPLPGSYPEMEYSSSFVSTNAAGDYQVVVSNAVGVVTSAVATVAVALTAPVITTQPQSQTVDCGRSVTFSVDVVGSQFFFYQWRLNGQNTFGSFSNTFSLYSVDPADAGDYTVVITNAVGAVTSAVARLDVRMIAPVIQAQPQSQNLYVGDSASLSISMVGAPVPTCDWYQNGRLALHDYASTYPGPYPILTSTFRFTSVTNANAGNYVVVVSNSVGAVTSAVAVITVQWRLPSVNSGPASQTVYAGSSAAFSVSAIGSPPLSFQWQRDGLDIPGATKSYLNLSGVSSNDAGSYRMVVTNPAGTAVSTNAILTVLYGAPTFTAQPQSQSITVDSTVTFSSLAVGGPPPVYQWYFRDQPIPNAQYSTRQFVVASTNQAGDYYVVATNVFGAATSQVARLTVLVTLPSFTKDPVSQGVVVGEGAGFDAWAEGHPWPVLQWQFNGQAIPGAIKDYFCINSVETTNAGNYAVVASNEAGSVTSRVAVLHVSLPGPLDRWEWRRPLPQGNDLWSVAYGNGRFVALGDNGAKLSSSDGGLTWTYGSEGVAQRGRVAWGNGLFVAVRYADVLWENVVCTVQTSTDGMHWTTLSPETYGALRLTDITFGGGRFVASDTSGRVIVSTNGLTWTAPVQIATRSLVRLAYLNGLFFAVVYKYDSAAGGPGGYLAVSPDGLTWTNRSINAVGYPQDITFGNGQFVMAWQSTSFQGVALTSPDGLSWTPHPIPGVTNSPDRIAYGAGTFVAVGESAWCALLSSRDGVNWAVRPTAPTNELYDVTFGGGRFVAVGNYGNIFVSTNGETWTTASGGTEKNLRSVARGQDLYVAVGNEGLLFTSPDGAAWTRRAAPISENLRGVTFGSGRFVAVGESDSTVLVSSNGIAWTQQTAYTHHGLYSVTFSGGQFVAVGDDGDILHSSDGLNWAGRSITDSRLNSIASGRGMLVAVGKDGVILTSTNGIDWRNVSPINELGFFQGVAYGNGRFVAAGQGGLLYTSTNGVNWEKRITPFASSYWHWTDIEDLSFANDVFIAVGQGGRIATSEDGLLWTAHRSGCHNDLRGILYAGSRFMAVGNNETILQSDFFGQPILHCRAYSDEGFEFLVEGEVGRTYKLQGSTDLVTWTDLFTFTSQQGRTVFLDGEAGVYSRQFYRVVSP